MNTNVLILCGQIYHLSYLLNSKYTPWLNYLLKPAMSLKVLKSLVILLMIRLNDIKRLDNTPNKMI